MVGTIGPMVHGRAKGSKAAMVMLFWGSHSLGGGVVGATLALMGHWLLPDALRTSRLQTVVFIIGCLLFSIYEARIIKLPLPQFKWQVPKRWRRFAGRGVVLYGSILGAGIGTRIVNTGFYVVLISVFLGGNVLFGTFVMVTYGLARGLPVTILAFVPPARTMTFMIPVLAAQQLVNLANSAILAYLGVLLFETGRMTVIR